jgi:starch synthase
MTKILMVASEAVPFIKTGGLGDVIGALPAALRARGEEVAVVLPFYKEATAPESRLLWRNHPVWLGHVCHPVNIHVAENRGVLYYLVQNQALFCRQGVYTDPEGKDFPDNHIRFAVLSHAALDLVRHSMRPQVIHCHDWQASLVPVYLRTILAGDPTFMGIKTLLTIHNLGFQGLFPPTALAEVGLEMNLFRIDAMEFFGKVNFLKGGIIFSDALSTVSRRYAEEIQTPELGFGLDGVLRSRREDLTGIPNGADYSVWNPETDPHLAANYSAADLSGKRICKKDLLQQCGLPTDRLDWPLIGIISRFTDQKGFDLLAEIADELTAEDLFLIALGTGQPEYEDLFRNLARKWPAKVAVRIAYDDLLAHKIEAGADMFLMPSRYEPCGLNQLYSLRYGTVPIVRATGGLDDTIDESTGFKFNEYSGRALLAAIRAALALFQDRQRWEQLMKNGMAKDFSWDASAAQYSALYKKLAG